MSSFSEGLASCDRCGALRTMREEPRLVGSGVPLWLRTIFRRLQLERGGSAPVEPTSIQTRTDQLRREEPSLSIDRMAIVCCYFNPLGYRSRSENYRRFAESLSASGVRLLTVELAIGDRSHELPVVYGDVLRVHSASLLWHKERLINLGIARLIDQGYEQIVWLDADVEFVAAREWPWFVADALRRAPLCQAFSSLVADTGARPVPASSAVSYFEQTGEVVDQATRAPGLGRWFGTPMGMPGYGWAARAEVLRECELYDRAIVGGGDKLIFAGAVCDDDRRSEVVEFVRSPLRACAQCGLATSPSEGLVKDVENWAASWYSAIDSALSVADLALKVMFHGSWQKRSYWLRQEILTKYQFDPAQDLTLNDDGCWEWASDKPMFHAAVSSYFASRDEDQP